MRHYETHRALTQARAPAYAHTRTRVHTHRHRQTDRHTHTHTHRHTDTDRQTQTHTHTDIHLVNEPLPEAQKFRDALLLDLGALVPYFPPKMALNLILA